jgi:5-carboxymethyl-2-hydroxymuconate isomerase
MLICRVLPTNPVICIEEEALFASGLTRERAFAIDALSIGTKNDDSVFVNLSEAFYKRVDKVQDEFFR